MRGGGTVWVQNRVPSIPAPPAVVRLEGKSGIPAPERSGEWECKTHFGAKNDKDRTRGAVSGLMPGAVAAKGIAALVRNQKR